MCLSTLFRKVCYRKSRQRIPRRPSLPSVSDPEPDERTPLQTSLRVEAPEEVQCQSQDFDFNFAETQNSQRNLYTGSQDAGGDINRVQNRVAIDTWRANVNLGSSFSTDEGMSGGLGDSWQLPGMDEILNSKPLSRTADVNAKPI